MSNPSSSQTKLALSVTSTRCAACKAGQDVPCDGWRYVNDTAASTFYDEPHVRVARCDIYLQRYARRCAEKAVADAGLPSSFVSVLDPEVHPDLVSLPALTVIYPDVPCPQSAYQVVQMTQTAVWYHAQVGHRPWYLYVPGVQWDAMGEVKQRAQGSKMVAFDRWDGGQLHANLLTEMCVVLEARIGSGESTIVSLLRPVDELQPRVPDEGPLIHRLQTEAARVGM